MKALSVRQPWASWIISGEKTIEWRSWRAKYRGELLICSSARPDDLYHDLGIWTREKMPLGMALGIVTLVDVRAFTRDDVKGALFGDTDDSEIMGFAWVLENPRPITPFPVKGKLNFFNVDLG